MADGTRHRLAMTAESVTYGTTPATPVFTTIRNTGTSLALSKDELKSDEMRSDRQTADVRQGARKVGGEFSFELSYGSYDALLEAVLCGTWATGTPSAGTDRLIAGTTRRSFTLERYFADMLSADRPFHRFTGCELASLQLTIAANAMIKGSMSIVGQGMATDTAIITGATYPAVSTTTPLDAFTGLVTEGGVSIAVITEVQLTLENGLNPRYVVGSINSLRPSIGNCDVKGTMTAYFENSALLDKFINETESSLIVNLPDAAGNNLRIHLPRIKYTGGQPDVKGPGPITLAMPFTALRDPTLLSNIVIERTPDV